MVAREANLGNLESAAVFAAASVDGDGKDSEYFELLRAADDLIEHSRLGVYGEFFAPFTHQFQVSIKATYPLEAKAFAEIDKVQRKAIFDALQMRAATFCIFLLVSLTPFLPYWGLRQRWIALAVSLGVTVFLTLVRAFIRREYLRTIGGDATKFANYFFKEASRIHDRAINAVHASTEDLMMTPSWPDRSAGWIKIALWHSKRYENLDRYVTASAWKIESRYRQIEQTFVWLKIAVAGLVTAALTIAVSQTPGDVIDTPVAPSVAVALFYFLIAYFFWGLRGQISNAFWGQKFRESIIGFDEQKEHIHNQIAKVIAADKKYYMGGQRNVGKEKG